jgi:hypothetical protein
VIPEIDIWRAANLMLKRYGDKALEQSHLRADELAPTAITTARRCGAASARRAWNLKTRHRPARYIAP